MAQKITIPVDVDAQGVEDGARSMARAFDSVAQSATKAAEASQKVDAAASGKPVNATTPDPSGALNASLETQKRVNKAKVRNAEDTAKAIAKAQEILSRELKRPVSTDDAKTALNNFERMQAGRGAGSQRLRLFDGFEQWYQGHEGSFASPRDAARHRRFVMAGALQNTQDARENGLPHDETPPEPGPEEGGGGGKGGGGRSLAGKAFSALKGFALPVLALSGVSSAMGMAGEGIGLANEESLAVDRMKRSMGDLGIDFSYLRTQTQLASEGLGISRVQAAKLGDQFAKVAGNLIADDLPKVGPAVNGAGMLARAVGIEPEAVNPAYAALKGAAAISLEPGSIARLGNTLLGAIERSGRPGQAQELISAVSGFTTMVARQTLQSPNYAAYAGAISSLTAQNAHLDIPGAVAAYGTADAAFRQGGAAGEAGQNFEYMALSRGTPGGINPLEAQWLEQGGLAATTQSIFGKDKLGNKGPGYGLFRGKLDSVTNLEKIQRAFGPGAGDNQMRIAKAGRLLGLSPELARAILKADPHDTKVAKDLQQRAEAENPAKAARDAAATLADIKKDIGEHLVPLTQQIVMAIGRLADFFVGPVRNVWDGMTPEEQAKVVQGEATQHTDVRRHLTSVAVSQGAKEYMARGVQEKGWTGWTASAMAAAGVTESGGWNPLAYNSAGGGQGARFLHQLRGERQTKFIAWAKANHRDPNDWKAQQDWDDIELHSIHRVAFRQMQEARTAEDATAGAMRFEANEGFRERGPTGARTYGSTLSIARTFHDHELPNVGEPGAPAKGVAQAVHVTGEVQVKDAQGKHIGTAVLKPAGPARPTGSTMSLMTGGGR